MQSSIPMNWPKEWASAERLALLAGTPVNCLLLENEPDTAFRTAAEKSGVRLLPPGQREVPWSALKEADWNTSSPVIGIKDGVWPHLGFKTGGDSADSGPTGAPWLDSNGWIIQFARSMAPGKEIWLKADPPDEKSPAQIETYRLAYAEAAAFGARRPIWLSPAHVKALAEGDTAAKGGWERLMADIRWFEERREWSSWPVVSRLVVISDFAGPNEYTGTEFLNLAERQNLRYEAAEPKRFTPELLRQRAAVIYVDKGEPPAAVLAGLQSFAESGRLVIGMKAPLAKLRGLRPSAETHPRFNLFSCGKGRVAVSKADWDDPWTLAQDTHLLMSRLHDQVRLFNGGSLLWRHTKSPDGRRRAVQILNYAGRWPAHRVSVQVTDKVASARWHTLTSEAPVAQEVHRAPGQQEIRLPSFTIYGAVELEVSVS